MRAAIEMEKRTQGFLSCQYLIGQFPCTHGMTSKTATTVPLCFASAHSEPNDDGDNKIIYSSTFSLFPRQAKIINRYLSAEDISLPLLSFYADLVYSDCSFMVTTSSSFQFISLLSRPFVQKAAQRVLFSKREGEGIESVL